MTTMLAHVCELGRDVQAQLLELLSKHSSVQPREPDPPGMIFINPQGDRSWRKLSDEGKRFQAAVAAEYEHFRGIICAITRGLPSDAVSVFEESDELIMEMIEQTRMTWCKNTSEASGKVVKKFDELLSLLERVPSAEGETIVVPDTNVLICSPRIESWTFDVAKSVTIVLAPTVLAELDAMKMPHKNESVRTKAESLIRTIKEYARRGNLHRGVNVVANRIKIRALAVEPKVEDSLPWLDPLNADDRIIATVVEIIRLHLRSTVVLCTGDINLFNKAGYARIPVVDPPASETATSKGGE